MHHKHRFFTVNNWIQWLEENITNSTKETREQSWHLLFGITLDSLWRSRNCWIFEQKRSPILNALIAIRAQAKLVVHSLEKRDIVNPNRCNKNESEIVRWITPIQGCWKLNCDGSARRNGREAGCGGILRDSYGRFVFGFSHKLDACSALEAEIWGLYHGLYIAWGKGFRKLIVETDSQQAFDLISDGRSGNEDLQKLIDGIHRIGKEDFDVAWSRVGREVNCCADLLARNNYEIRDTIVIYDSMPDFLVNVVSKDSSGLASPSMQ